MYKLSPQGEDKLRNIVQHLEKSDSQALTGMEAEVTTSFLQDLLGVQSINEVISDNEELTKNNKGIINMYGFESMYDLYMYAMSCDRKEESLTKKKDYSKLVPVKRKVTRNGREMEVTIWESPGGDEDKDSEGGEEGSKGSGSSDPQRKKHAKDFIARILGDEDKIDPKDIAEIKREAESMPNGDKEFEDGLDYYLVVRGDKNEVQGIVGYSESDKFIKMEFYRSTGEVPGVATRGFFELLVLASKKGKGVEVDDQESARPVFEAYDLEKKEGSVWSIEPKKLKDLLGDG